MDALSHWIATHCVDAAVPMFNTSGEHPYKDLTPSLVLVKVLAGRLRPNLPSW